MTTNKPEVVAWAPSLDLANLSLNGGGRNGVGCILTAGPTPHGNDVAMVRLEDYESLQAECEKLREQYRKLIELGEDFQWENIIRVDISDFPSRADAIDTAIWGNQLRKR